LKIYEGMFVLDDTRCKENWDAVSKEVRGLLEKHRAEIFTFERWDERRLAYRIQGHNRAVYLLSRFTAPPEAIGEINRDCQLNTTVLRVLIVRDQESEKLHKAGLFPPRPEEPKPQEPEKAAEPAQEQAQPAQQESLPAEPAAPEQTTVPPPEEHTEKEPPQETTEPQDTNPDAQ